MLEQFIRNHPMQATRITEGLEEEDISALIEGIPAELAVQLVNLMNVYKAAKCLRLIKPGLTAEILEKSDIQKTELLVRQADEDFRSDLLGRLSPKLSEALRQKLEYPAHSVGALMNPVGFLLQEDVSVQSAIEALKREKSRIASSVCVVNREGVLTGIIRLHDLLLADETDEIAAVMKTDMPNFFADWPVESIKSHPGWYDNRSIPVVDDSKRLIGMLNFETAQQYAAETGGELTRHVMETGNALGELYRIGLAAFLQSVSK